MASGLPSLMYRTVWGADYDKGYRYGYRQTLSFSTGMVPHAVMHHTGITCTVNLCPLFRAGLGARQKINYFGTARNGATGSAKAEQRTQTLGKGGTTDTALMHTGHPL